MFCIQGGMCSVYLQDTEKVVSISSEHLEPVTPTKNNKVLLLSLTDQLRDSLEHMFSTSVKGSGLLCQEVAVVCIYLEKIQDILVLW